MIIGTCLLSWSLSGDRAIKTATIAGSHRAAGNWDSGCTAGTRIRRRSQTAGTFHIVRNRSDTGPFRIHNYSHNTLADLHADSPCD